MSDTTKYRTYRVSVNFFFYSYYGSSKVYTIPEGKSTILPGLPYSFLTFLLGWWGFDHLPWRWFKKTKYSLSVLHINFTGGDDYTKSFTEMDYDAKTVWIYNNLDRATSLQTNLNAVAILVELQEEYARTTPDLYTTANCDYLRSQFAKINIPLSLDTIGNMLITYRLYDSRSLD